MTRRMVSILFLAASLAIFFVAGHAEEASEKVFVIKVEGVINPVSAEFIGKSIREAESMNAEAVVIELDTPGGLDTSMRQIIKDIIGSSVPVVVFVSPSGARAASAGAFITIAAHVAAMAPGTNIGAAHPVAVGNKMDDTMAAKATNDAAAYIRSLAERTGRNADWAEDAVRKSVSATESEALEKNVIDIVSGNISTLLKDIDGRKVTLPAGEKTLKTAAVSVVEKEMGTRYKILKFISDPSVAYMLMLLGFYGLFFELTNPGTIFPGVAGAFFLILAFYSFQTLPVNYAGLLLIVFGIVLFILEIKVISHGMLTVGGIISMVIGSLMLFESPAPFLRLSLYLILPVVLVTAVFFSVTFGLVYKAFRRSPVTGREGMVGSEGVVRTAVSGGGGMVLVHGELWSAFSDEPIEAGEKVVVESVSDLTIKVKKVKGG